MRQKNVPFFDTELIGEIMFIISKLFKNISALKNEKIPKIRRKLKSDSRGRSMTELLAVLALMAILSVIGIMGYSYGMDKWRANETLDELNNRTNLILESFARTGQISDNEFSKTTRLGYLVELKGDSTIKPSRLKITVKGAETGVCRELINMGRYLAKEMLIGHNQARKDNCEQAKNIGLTFVFDTSDYEAGMSERDFGACRNGNVYLSYMENPCETETIMNETICLTEDDCTSWNSACCIEGECVSGEIDSSTKERVCEDNEYCLKNSDCENSEYCNLSGDDCRKPKTGTCTQIKKMPDVVLNGKRFRQSQNAMSWWAAENWCKAQGMNLISLEEIDCEIFKGTYCTSNTLLSLRLAGIGRWFWVRNANEYDPACRAWHVRDTNFLAHGGRTGSINHLTTTALCIGQ